jgi:hypothetical protein
MPHPALWPNLAWWLSRAPGARRFRAALSDPAQAQHALLMRLLRRHAGTAFGREHGFREMRSVDDFQRRVPLADYDAHEHWIGRVRQGEAQVLTADPVTHLVPTSGSSAAAKLIPFTSGLQREFAAAIGPWIFDLYRRRPALMAGPAYWSITPAVDPPDLESAVPVGFGEDTEYLGGRWRGLVESTLAVPPSVARLRDPAEHRRATLVALLRTRHLRLMSVWHPSWLGLLMEAMQRDWNELLAAIPERARVAELEQCGPSECRQIWPKLGLISCWADGPAAVSLPTIRRRFPGVPIQPKGLLATEAVVTIPLGESRPLAVGSHFFEFLDDAGEIRLARDLVEGGEYSVVVTTGGGLYRYRLGDRVRVRSFVAATPALEFLGKEDGISDLRGEKLSEGFVAGMLPSLLDEHRLVADLAMLVPAADGLVGSYTLLVESPEPVPEGCAASLESRLRENPHYRCCVDHGQLEPATIERVPSGAFQRYAAWCQERGARLGQIKPRVLESDPAALSAVRGNDRVAKQ